MNSHSKPEPHIKFHPPLISGRLVKRYKRFLADVTLENGDQITVHCPNSGSMRTCVGPNWEVRISDSQNPKRKYRHTLEMVHNGICWIGVNTARPNPIVEEAILRGDIPELSGFPSLKREIKYGKNSRIDILLEGPQRRCYVEVKNTTLVEEDGFYRFPDAVTERGTKHLEELENMVREGHEAAMVFTIQRSDGTIFKPADRIDPKYGAELRKAHKMGVAILPYRVDVSPEGLQLKEKIPFDLDP